MHCIAAQCVSQSLFAASVTPGYTTQSMISVRGICRSGACMCQFPRQASSVISLHPSLRRCRLCSVESPVLAPSPWILLRIGQSSRVNCRNRRLSARDVGHSGASSWISAWGRQAQPVTCACPRFGSCAVGASEWRVAAWIPTVQW